MTELTWKQQLHGQIDAPLEQEIDEFETQLQLRQQGKIGEKMFAETRLRRGTYGQRYDNGQRHDGVAERTLPFPEKETKGPDTLWDAPGMQRIKIPYGKLSAKQLEVLAELAEEYSDRILHITTRQDVQLHFVHIDDTPDLMRRLAAVGITTREACGNSVRNVTACPYAGVCQGETFDVTPYSHAITYFLLGHPDAQDFGRKFKIAFSGCHEEACGLVAFHDLGAIAKTRADEDGQVKRGFEVYVGGGLGAVPFQAKVIGEFVPEEELLPLSQAVCRVFARYGEKDNRARARVKFLVQKLGIEEFKRLVYEERKQLRPDPRWTEFLEDLHCTDETPLREGGPIPQGPHPEGFEQWSRTNLRPQRQPGYYVATVALPLGDLTSPQARALADLARKYTGDTLRTTVEQNLAFRWMSGRDVVDFYRDLQALQLGDHGASTISDLVACPGTDTCKLGISSSRGLAGELKRRLDVVRGDLDPAVQKLRIKASGCFNACGQHHVADLGFLGVSRNVGGRRMPHFQVVLGGQWDQNGGSYGLPIGAIPSKNVPAAIERLTERYVAEREDDETFQSFVKRIGKAEIRKTLGELTKAPKYEQDPSYFVDWGDPREYTIGDMGKGECAGEVVPFVEFGLQSAERQSFEAQIQLDGGNPVEAARKAYEAMLTAAQALVRHRGVQVGDDGGEIVEHFREQLHDTKLFHDKYAGAKFANYLFRAHDEQSFDTADRDGAHTAIDEANLFIEAAHACYERITQKQNEATAAE